jgi:hypothetical protein
MRETTQAMGCINRLFLCVASVSLVACVSNTRIEGIPPEEAQLEIEAPGAKTLRFEQPPIITAAATNDASLLLAFEADGQARFVRGTRDNRQNISAHIDWFPVYQMLPVDSETFAAQNAATDSIGFYQADIWQAVRQAIFEQLTPPGEGEGALLNYRDIEYLWYRTDDGALTGVDLKKKPAEVAIARQYRMRVLSLSSIETLANSDSCRSSHSPLVAAPPAMLQRASISATMSSAVGSLSPSTVRSRLYREYSIFLQILSSTFPVARTSIVRTRISSNKISRQLARKPAWISPLGKISSTSSSEANGSQEQSRCSSTAINIFRN